MSNIKNLTADILEDTQYIYNIDQLTASMNTKLGSIDNNIETIKGYTANLNLLPSMDSSLSSINSAVASLSYLSTISTTLSQIETVSETSRDYLQAIAEDGITLDASGIEDRLDLGNTRLLALMGQVEDLQGGAAQRNVYLADLNQLVTQNNSTLTDLLTQMERMNDALWHDPYNVIEVLRGVGVGVDAIKDYSASIKARLTELTAIIAPVEQIATDTGEIRFQLEQMGADLDGLVLVQEMMAVDVGDIETNTANTVTQLQAMGVDLAAIRAAMGDNTPGPNTGDDFGTWSAGDLPADWDDDLGQNNQGLVSGHVSDTVIAPEGLAPDTSGAAHALDTSVPGEFELADASVPSWDLQINVSGLGAALGHGVQVDGSYTIPVRFEWFEPLRTPVHLVIVAACVLWCGTRIWTELTIGGATGDKGA